MKILHIFSGPVNPDAKRMIELQKKKHDVEILELTEKQPDYLGLIRKIESCDRVISW